MEATFFFLMAEQLASPVARCEAALLGQLTPPQWALLRKGQPLVFSTEPQESEIPLPDEIARAFHAARPDMGNGMQYGDPVHEEQERERQQNLKTEWAAATGYQVRIALDTSRFQTDGEISLKAAAIPLHGGLSAGPAAFLEASGTALFLGVGPSFVFQWD